jgi:hypothetical protein
MIELTEQAKERIEKKTKTSLDDNIEGKKDGKAEKEGKKDKPQDKEGKKK